MIDRTIRVPMLTEADCEHWALQVLLLKQYWIRRHEALPFHTLGLASYLDCFGSPQKLTNIGYEPTVISQHNQVLSAHFSELYQQLIVQLSDHFQLKACYNINYLSLPGFHIYGSDPIFAESIGQIHRDLQFKWLFGVKNSDADVMTFTLPISLPQDSGLNFYDNGASEPSEYCPYQLGEVLIHSGLRTHQAVVNCIDDQDERITLQGHGFRLNDNLSLYG